MSEILNSDNIKFFFQHVFNLFGMNTTSWSIHVHTTVRVMQVQWSNGVSGNKNKTTCVRTWCAISAHTHWILFSLTWHRISLAITPLGQNFWLWTKISCIPCFDHENRKKSKLYDAIRENEKKNGAAIHYHVFGIAQYKQLLTIKSILCLRSRIKNKL